MLAHLGWCTNERRRPCAGGAVRFRHPLGRVPAAPSPDSPRPGVDHPGRRRRHGPLAVPGRGQTRETWWLWIHRGQRSGRPRVRHRLMAVHQVHDRRRRSADRDRGAVQTVEGCRSGPARESVDVVQPLVPRLLGLAEVRLEVAGGSSTEAPLAYLALADARELKGRLLASASRARRPGWRSPPDEQMLLRVPVERLVAAALLSGAWVASGRGGRTASYSTCCSAEEAGHRAVPPCRVRYRSRRPELPCRFRLHRGRVDRRPPHHAAG